jgi:hypothetical protein
MYSFRLQTTELRRKLLDQSIAAAGVRPFLGLQLEVAC